MTKTLSNRYDVVVIGGGAAGLSGALTLTRARRSVLVIDAGEPRNAPAAHLHGFLSRDGAAPSELLANGRREVTGYGGEIVSGVVTSARREEAGGFRLTLADGRVTTARRLLVTTGLTDELPDLPGLAELWGTDVIHCPYCHGWEVRDQPIGVLSTGPMAIHQAQLFRQWSDDVVLFGHTGPEPTETEHRALTARGIRFVAGQVERLETENGRLHAVRMVDGSTVERRALVVAPRFTARVGPLAELGLTAVPLQLNDFRLGSRLTADPTGRTEVPGVWVAGNVTDLMAQLIAAAASGVTAAAAINGDLIDEEVATALRAADNPFSAAAEAALNAQVQGDRRHGLTVG
ncbi:NAD(P)/FAD-dependent oxidoreductase [Nakamurella lactea]|uniref:NAD(P)/FAD-dependent oxidoreductase n=1 Tax=Nakamurella lactea TaxID=459515 RepID=UPI00048F29A1|nr:NAD(P)/FAD-dependent oxidoreductase [Nakamurella lactea]